MNGQCPQSWNDLLFWLSIARIIDGNRGDVLYYGLFPIGIPIGGAAGCGGGSANVGSGANRDGMTMAHELGHMLGFGHGPCGLGIVFPLNSPLLRWFTRPGDPNYPGTSHTIPLRTEPHRSANTV